MTIVAMNKATYEGHRCRRIEPPHTIIALVHLDLSGIRAESELKYSKGPNALLGPCRFLPLLDAEMVGASAMNI